ncbi:MAG: DNA-processing protein DprA [Prevotellaceae bacterium]|nr:DNA-processing protein DprA [Prevotellaceae bacterium]
MSSQELIYSIALTKLKGLSLLNARTLYDTLGSAEEVFAHRKDIFAVIPDASKRLVEALGNVDDALRVAEQEMEFVEKKHLKVLTIGSDDYPHRLRECEDAPLVLYYCGSADLNRQRVVCVVGTRKCSEYGRELCRNFIADLKRHCPDTLIVSGLAYGMDICAHRQSLEQGVDTVAVLAHGLDNIYPYTHRQTAADMVHNGGGLITEYTTQTRPERMNFVRRNRIVAGLSDACIVVESSAKGGSLITAELSQNYNRDVFAFPGRVYDECSAGCNNLIRRQQATLITCADDFIEAIGWQSRIDKKNTPKAIQQDIFPELTDEERLLVNVLQEVDDKHVNQLSVDTNIPYSRVSMILFDLEMKGIIMALGGARYRLLRREV